MAGHERLTLEDWRILNSALALLDATPAEESGVYGADAEEAYAEAIESARRKVHQRLAGRDLDGRWSKLSELPGYDQEPF